MQMPRIYLPGLDSSSLHDDMVAPDTGSGVVYAALGRRFSLACRIEPPFPAVNQTVSCVCVCVCVCDSN